jgi:RNA polymerase sigma factor (sigma-70 family)
LKIRQDRELIRECLHILFCELWEQRKRLPRDVKDPKFYLFTWFKRTILKHIPQESITISALAEEPKEESVETQHIEIEQLMETHLKLEAALLKLTKKQQRYIRLRFFENMSYETISKLENASIRTVYNVIYEALKSLKSNIICQSLFILIFSK